MRTTRLLINILFVALFLTVMAYGAEVVRGQRVTFYVQADGSEPMTFTWYRNDVLIHTGTLYVIESFSEADVGVYRAKATNELGSADSEEEQLTLAEQRDRPKVPRDVKVDLSRKEEKS